MGHRDHNFFFLDQVFHVEIVDVDVEGGAARVTVLFLEFDQLILDDAENETFVGEDRPIFGNLLRQRRVFFFDFFTFETGQALQTHVQNGLGLDVGQRKVVHQAGLRDFRVVGFADDFDDRVDVVEGDPVAFQNVGPGFGLLQVEFRPADHHFLLVFDVIVEDLLQVQNLRLTVHQRQHDHAVGVLELGVLVQLVQDDRRVGVPLQVDDDADAVLQVRFVADVGDAFDGLVLDELSDFLNQLRLVDHVGQLGDNDLLLAPLGLLNVDLRADLDAAAAGAVGVADAALAEDDPGGREVRPLDRLHQLVDSDVRIIDVGDGPVTDSPRLCGGMFVAIPTAIP